MDKNIESQIIEAFILKQKRERAKFELWNDKKRKQFIWNIVVRKYYDEKYAHKISLDNFSTESVYDLLKNYGAPDNCYSLSPNSDFDGVILPLKVALDQLVYNGPVFISCIHGKLVYLENEPTIGAPDRYLLIRND